MPFKNSAQKGQGLLEVLAALAVGTILVVALVSLSIRANATADASRTANEASKLAEEGLEAIRFIKNSNTPGGTDLDALNGLPLVAMLQVANGSCLSSSDAYRTWSGFYAIDLDEDCNPLSPYGRRGVLHYVKALANGEGNHDYCLPWCLHIAGDTFFDVKVRNVIFTRTVYVADTFPVSKCNDASLDYTKMKQFTVVVTWSDPSGSHQSVVSDCIGA